MKKTQQLPSSQINFSLTLQGEQAMYSSSLACTAQMNFYSSNTWIGNIKPYVKTITSQETDNNVVSELEFVFIHVELLNQRGQFVGYGLGKGNLNGKFFLGSPIRLKLIGCRKHRYRVHRPSYHPCGQFKPRHHQSIDRCCFPDRDKCI